MIRVRAWPVDLIGLLNPLLCAGSDHGEGAYQPAEKGYNGSFKRPSERDQQAVLCTACKTRSWYLESISNIDATILHRALL